MSTCKDAEIAEATPVRHHDREERTRGSNQTQGAAGGIRGRREWPPVADVGRLGGRDRDCREIGKGLGQAEHRRRRRLVERNRVGEGETSRPGPTQGHQRGPATERLADVADERPDIGPFAAADGKAGPRRTEPREITG